MPEPDSLLHRRKWVDALLTVGRYGKPPRVDKPRRPRPTDKPPTPGDPRWPDYQRSRGEW
jgi:hypothetical protein